MAAACRFWSAPLFFEPNRDEGVVFVIDMTERKRAEEKLRASEQRVLDAQMELAHVNRVTTMGQLAASIALEVNQPLAAVAANAEACLRWLNRGTPDLDAARRSVEWIIDDGNRASEVSAARFPMSRNSFFPRLILSPGRALGFCSGTYSSGPAVNGDCWNYVLCVQCIPTRSVR